MLSCVLEGVIFNVDNSNEPQLQQEKRCCSLKGGCRMMLGEAVPDAIPLQQPCQSLHCHPYNKWMCVFSAVTTDTYLKASIQSSCLDFQCTEHTHICARADSHTLWCYNIQSNGIFVLINLFWTN